MIEIARITTGPDLRPAQHREVNTMTIIINNKPVKVPKYVQEIMGRSRYEFDRYTNDPNYAPGYTIRITKSTPYTYAETFRAEIERLVKWVNRQTPSDGMEHAYILSVPAETHHRDQVAIVTIFDPVMQKIEHLIQE